MIMVQAFRAGTTFPNTPETDMMPQVYHTVHYTSSKGSGVAFIKAADPGEAISKINGMSEEHVERWYSIKPLSN